MDTDLTQQICYVEVTEEMKKKEEALSNAFIATPNKSIKDIHLAMQSKYGASAQPTKIEKFPPDYILYFPTLYAW
ncbi:unnamed protein product [Urochloa humidicola]